MSEILKLVKELIFSRRRMFFQHLEIQARSKIKVNVAWPDILLFLNDEDFKLAYDLASMEINK